MEWVETTAKTVDAAREAALDEAHPSSGDTRRGRSERLERPERSGRHVDTPLEDASVERLHADERRPEGREVRRDLERL